MSKLAWRRSVIAVLLFGVSFGYVEASVVVYLRTLYEPLRQRFHPGRAAGDLFPLLTPAQLETLGPEQVRLLVTEFMREAATLLMLASIGIAVAGRAGQFVAAFLVAFGIWDISFYLFLKVLINWPDSFFTWDILFLLPVPWVGPVLAPMLVALSMIGAGLAVLRRESAGAPVRFATLHWAGIFGGGLIILAAFMWDFRNTGAGGAPHPFNWPMFTIGEITGLGAFLMALTGGKTVTGGSLSTPPR